MNKTTKVFKCVNCNFVYTDAVIGISVTSTCPICYSLGIQYIQHAKDNWVTLTGCINKEIGYVNRT